MTDIDVAKRLEELRLFTKQPLNVEQRIEIAKQQQAIRDAKKMAKDEMARVKEKVRKQMVFLIYINDLFLIMLSHSRNLLVRL